MRDNIITIIVWSFIIFMCLKTFIYDKIKEEVKGYTYTIVIDKTEDIK